MRVGGLEFVKDSVKYRGAIHSGASLRARENRESKPSGSDLGGLLAGLLERARRRNLSANSLTTYERTWTKFLAWAAAEV
jgi:hypothetical protein